MKREANEETNSGWSGGGRGEEREGLRDQLVRRREPSNQMLLVTDEQ